MRPGMSNPVSQIERLVPLADFARSAGVDVQTLRRHIKAGTLVAYRVGGRLIRVDPDEAARALMTRIPADADVP